MKKITYGIIGKPLSHSFSKKYFTEKLLSYGFPNQLYENFEIDNAYEIIQIIKQNPGLKGLNVTYPYKEEIIDFIDDIDMSAKSAGAVNVIKIFKGITKGYNTDITGFELSLLPHLKKNHTSALILGTGGAAKAVAFVLRKLDIQYLFVSRNAKNTNEIDYKKIDKFFSGHKLIINATPVGMFPDTNRFPDIPYQKLDSSYLLFDLIYNPTETIFLNKGKLAGASIVNGLEMLKIQADEAWKIWNE